MCTGVRSGSIEARKRTQSSIAISSSRGDWVLFNASPDILQQIQATDELQPARSLRDTGIGAIVLMDAQIDHTTGLLMLREHRERLPLWCTSAVREDLLEGNPVFRVLDHYCGIDWHELKTDGAPVTISCAPGLSFQPLGLTSNAPPYSPHRDRPVDGDTLGMTITDDATGKRLFYAPGVGEMEEHVWQAMQQSDVVMVDGTMWTDDEMIRRGASAKTARSMGHLPQSGSGGMIEWLDQLPATTRKILIHINNTNPILDEAGAERRLLTEHGIEVAHDGLQVQLEA